ncbi:hypothetical protein [Natrinema sp. JCM 9743]
MTDRDERGKDVTSRLSKRFETEPDEPDESSEADERSGSSKPSETSEPAQNDEPSKGDERDEQSETDVSAESDDSAESGERSGSSKPSDPSKQAQRSEGDKRNKLSKKSKGDKQSGGSSGKVNVKEEWTGRYMYLPDEIDEQFDEFDRLVYECGQELDWKPKKNKHFYPVVVSRGIEAVAEMDAGEFVEAVDKLELPRDR